LNKNYFQIMIQFTVQLIVAGMYRYLGVGKGGFHQGIQSWHHSSRPTAISATAGVPIPSEIVCGWTRVRLTQRRTRVVCKERSCGMCAAQRHDNLPR
jgi:hypothetical protein